MGEISFLGLPAISSPLIDRPWPELLLYKTQFQVNMPTEKGDHGRIFCFRLSRESSDELTIAGMQYTVSG